MDLAGIPGQKKRSRAPAHARLLPAAQRLRQALVALLAPQGKPARSPKTIPGLLRLRLSAGRLMPGPPRPALARPPWHARQDKYSRDNTPGTSQTLGLVTNQLAGSATAVKTATGNGGTAWVNLVGTKSAKLLMWARPSMAGVAWVVSLIPSRARSTPIAVHTACPWPAHLPLHKPEVGCYPTPGGTTVVWLARPLVIPGKSTVLLELALTTQRGRHRTWAL